MASQPVTLPTTATTTASSSTNALPVSWALGFLTLVGAPTTQNNIDNLLRWGNAESGGSQKFGGWSNYNPLNIVTQPGDNSTGAGGQQGDIANFGSLSDGVAASARLFQGNPNAAPIIQTLRNNGSTDQLNTAVNGFYSTWGGSINITGASSTAQNVTTTGITSDITSGLENLPFVGGLFSAATSTGSLAGQFLGLLTDWRYVVEVIAGLAMTVLGVVIILKDTGALRAAGKGAEGAAAVGAAAA